MEVDLSDYFAGLSRHLSDASRELETEFGAELESFGERARQSAVAMSDGGYSLAALAKLGHPYARRAPKPPMDAAIINRQSGRFLRSWRVSPLERSLDGIGVRVVNDAPYADYLDEGTTRMIRRPIIQRLEEKLLPELTAALDAAAHRFWGRFVPELTQELGISQ